MKEIAQKWLEFAKQDLRDAEILFQKRSYRGASWHCHQAIEKILKAITIKKRKRPRKIHDLLELLNETKIKLPEELMRVVEELDNFYLMPRYPDIYEQMKKIYRPQNMQRIFKLTKILFLWLRNYINQK